jgi:hypothetical protein
MALFPSIRLVGLLEDLIKSLVLIMMKLSAQLLNRVRFGSVLSIAVSR